MLGLSPSNRHAFFLHADLLGHCGIEEEEEQAADNKDVVKSEYDERQVKAPASEPPPHIRQRKRKHETNRVDDDDHQLTPNEHSHSSHRIPHSARATTMTMEMDGPPTREGSIRRLRSRLDFSEQQLEIAAKEFAVSTSNAFLSLAHSFEMDYVEMKEDPVEIVPSSILSDTAATHDKDDMNLSQEEHPATTRSDAAHMKSPVLHAAAAAFPFTQPLESLMMVAPEMSLSARLSQSPPSPTGPHPVRESDPSEPIPTCVTSSQRAEQAEEDNEVMSKVDDGWCFPSASIPESSIPSRSQSRFLVSRRSSSYRAAPQQPPLPLPLPSSATNSPSFVPTSPSAVSSIAPPSTAASLHSSNIADLELPSQLLGVVGVGGLRSRNGLSQTSRASFKGSGTASNAASSVLAGASLPFCTPPAVAPHVTSKAPSSIAHNNDSPASSPAAFQYDPFQLTQTLLYPENNSVSISLASSHLLSTLSTLDASYPDWILRIESLIRVMQRLRTDEFKFANLTFLHSLLINGEISSKQLPPFCIDNSSSSFTAPDFAAHDLLHNATLSFFPPVPKIEPIQGVNPQCWEWIRKTTPEQLQEQYTREQKQLKEDAMGASIVKVKSSLPPIAPNSSSVSNKPIVSTSRRNGSRAVLPLPLPTASSQDSAPAHISDLLSELD